MKYSVKLSWLVKGMMIAMMFSCSQLQPEETVPVSVMNPFYNTPASIYENHAQPKQVILTWQNDPATTMTITWRTDVAESSHTLSYSENPDTPEQDWITREAITFTFPESKAWLHTVELTNLIPGHTYFVTINHPYLPDKFSFSTMPDENSRRDIIFLAGGDTRAMREARREVNALAAKQNPDFIMLNGDLIDYALSETEWDEWFDDWHEQLITPDGRRIPLIPAIGNHEVVGFYLQPRSHSPFYFNRFIVPEPKTRYILKLSPDLVVITLDSDHILDVISQTDWLDWELTVNKNIRWKIAQYHVTAWPSYRGFNEPLPVKIRTHWVPLFEKHGVQYVSESHDHTLKRTVPIRNNRIDNENGVVYLGDGGWGAPLRDPKNPKDYWWLEETVKTYHFWKFMLPADGNNLTVEAVIHPAN